MVEAMQVRAQARTACARALTPCGLAPRYKIPVLNFDQFMSNVQATGSRPYLVLNYDSCNLINGSGDWSYSQLLALAQSWIAYIVRKGYKVTSAQGAQPPHPSFLGPHAVSSVLLAQPSPGLSSSDSAAP